MEQCGPHRGISTLKMAILRTRNRQISPEISSTWTAISSLMTKRQIDVGIDCSAEALHVGQFNLILIPPASWILAASSHYRRWHHGKKIQNHQFEADAQQ